MFYMSEAFVGSPPLGSGSGTKSSPLMSTLVGKYISGSSPLINEKKRSVVTEMTISSHISLIPKKVPNFRIDPLMSY